MLKESIDYDVIDDDFLVLRTITIPTNTPAPTGVVSSTWANGKCVLAVTSTRSVLTVHPEYLWGGISGPLVKDTPKRMEATLFHDALYEALRGRLVPAYGDSTLPEDPTRGHWNTWRAAREWADDCFLEILRRDDSDLAGIMHFAVRWFAATSAWPDGWPLLMDVLRGFERHQRR